MIDTESSWQNEMAAIFNTRAMKKSIVAQNIRTLRESKNQTQQEFADEFKVTRGAIESYEQGRAEPKSALVVKITEHFGIHAKQLFNELIDASMLKPGTKPSGYSLTEIKLQEANKQIELLKNTIKDKDRIINLYQKAIVAFEDIDERLVAVEKASGVNKKAMKKKIINAPFGGYAH